MQQRCHTHWGHFIVLLVATTQRSRFIMNTSASSWLVNNNASSVTTPSWICIVSLRTVTTSFCLLTMGSSWRLWRIRSVSCILFCVTVKTTFCDGSSVTSWRWNLLVTPLALTILVWPLIESWWYRSNTMYTSCFKYSCLAINCLNALIRSETSLPLPGHEL